MTTENTSPAEQKADTDFVKATQAIKAARLAQPTKSIIYETGDVGERRIRFDRNVLPLPADAAVCVEVEPDGSGYVVLRVPAAKIQVIPAGKRLATRRVKKVTDAVKEAE